MKAGYFPHIPEEMPDIPSNVPYVRGMVLMPGQTSGITFLSDVVLTEEIFNSEERLDIRCLGTNYLH
jgi:hypothetical protein